MTNIKYISDEQYVYVQTTDEFNADEVHSFLHEATKIARENKANKILLDHRGTAFHAKTMEIHEITKNLVEFGFKNNIKGAVIYDQDTDKYEFADNVAHNWSNNVLKFFDSFDDGKKWLFEKLI